MRTPQDLQRRDRFACQTCVNHQDAQPVRAFFPHGKAINLFNRDPDGTARTSGPRPILCPHVRSSHAQGDDAAVKRLLTYVAELEAQAAVLERKAA